MGYYFTVFLDPQACQETFWTLLRDKAHWEFEMFLMLIFDIILGGLAWPFLKKHFEHHLARDKREAEAAENPNEVNRPACGPGSLAP